MTASGPRRVRYPAERYMALVDAGVFGATDHVQLLDGFIVAEPPARPPQASMVGRVADALRRVVGERALINVQQPFEAGPNSVPEPDVTVIPGTRDDYDTRHPDAAWLVVEVADSSLPQDRLTKAPVYAAAGIPEYWIVNLRERCVEVHREPRRAEARFAVTTIARRGEAIELAVLPGARVRVDELFPVRRPGA